MTPLVCKYDHCCLERTRVMSCPLFLKYRLIPGLAYTLKVRFCPDEWRYFYDCIQVHCKVRIWQFGLLLSCKHVGSDPIFNNRSVKISRRLNWCFWSLHIFFYTFPLIQLNLMLSQGDEKLLIPVHAYPVIGDLHIPPCIDLPDVPLGKRCVSHNPKWSMFWLPLCPRAPFSVWIHPYK